MTNTLHMEIDFLRFILLVYKKEQLFLILFVNEKDLTLFLCRRHRCLHGVLRPNPERLRLPLRHDDRPLPQAEMVATPIPIPRSRQDQRQLPRTAGPRPETRFTVPDSALQSSRREEDQVDLGGEDGGREVGLVWSAPHCHGCSQPSWKFTPGNNHWLGLCQ